MSQPDVTDPGWASGPQLQASPQHQVVEVLQGVTTRPSLWGASADKVDISEGPAGGTLGNSPWRSANVVSGISSAIGFPTSLVEVAARICGRNVKALIDCGSMGNYISDSLVPALRMEAILEKDFKVLELANQTIVKGARLCSLSIG